MKRMRYVEQGFYIGAKRRKIASFRLVSRAHKRH
jgi:hypothetical protein